MPRSALRIGPRTATSITRSWFCTGPAAAALRCSPRNTSRLSSPMARPGRATLLSELSRQFWPRRINQVQRWLRIAISALLLRRFGQSSAQADYREQNAGADPNDLLYSLEASQDYDPEPGLSQIRAKVYALNFSDDEFNLAHWRRCGFDDVFQLPEFVLEGARLRREVRALWRRPS